MMLIDLIYIQQNVFPNKTKTKKKIFAIKNQNIINKLYMNQILIHLYQSITIYHLIDEF